MTLTDTQAILLSNALKRDSGSIYPLPTTITAGPGPITKSLATMARRGLVEERETSIPEQVSRIDDVTRYAVFITAAGRAAIGCEDAPEQAVAAPVTAAATASKPTKAALVLGMLGRPDGATLAELIDATGWLPHTTRAVLTGIRKKGRTLDKAKRDGATCYRIVEAA